MGRANVSDFNVVESHSSGVHAVGVGAMPRPALIGERVSMWWTSRYGYRLFAELGVMYVLLQVYRFVRTVKSADLVVAFSHSADVQRFEQWLPLPSEEVVQQTVMQVPFAIEFLNRYYVFLHFPSIFVLVVSLYVFAPRVYRPIRNLLVMVTFSALLIHLAYPLAPPRMMESFIDTISIYGPSVYPPSSFNGVANQIAAMPSLHFGWAAIEAMAVIWVFNSRWRWVALVHPIIMTTAIVATANHWWADAMAAGALILLALPSVKFLELLTSRFDERGAAGHEAPSAVVHHHSAQASSPVRPHMDDESLPEPEALTARELQLQ